MHNCSGVYDASCRRKPQSLSVTSLDSVGSGTFVVDQRDIVVRGHYKLGTTYDHLHVVVDRVHEIASLFAYLGARSSHNPSSDLMQMATDWTGVRVEGVVNPSRIRLHSGGEGEQLQDRRRKVEDCSLEPTSSRATSDSGDGTESRLLEFVLVELLHSLHQNPGVYCTPRSCVSDSLS